MMIVHSTNTIHMVLSEFIVNLFITRHLCCCSPLLCHRCQRSFDHVTRSWNSDFIWNSVRSMQFNCSPNKKKILNRFRRLRQYPRNILHANMFFVFLLRSIVQLIAEVFMSKGYFTHNVFERMDACNRTTVYFQEGNVSRQFLYISLKFQSVRRTQ